MNDVILVIDWAIIHSQHEADSLQADRFRILKSYLVSKNEGATEILTASDVASMGGKTSTEAKRAAARENAKKGGAPGNYYACAYDQSVIAEGARRKAHYLVFSTKENRDLWVQQGPISQREPIPATDTDLRWTQRNRPADLLDGDEIIESLIAREDLHDEFERYHDIG